MPFFKETGILYVKHLAIYVEYNKDGKPEATTVLEPFHQDSCLLLLFSIFRFAGIVVHVDVLKVLVNHFTDGCILRNEIGKPKAPRAPVSSNLTNHELAISLSFDDSMVYLLQRINVFVINLFDCRLSCS